MTVFDDELAAHSRTPQCILTLGCRYCANWYSKQTEQFLTRTEEFDHADWTNVSVTVGADSAVAPDGETTAEAAVFNAANDALSQTVVGEAVTSKAFTGSVWIAGGAGVTVTLRVRNVGSTETGSNQVTLSTSWARYSVHKLFTAGPVDDVVFEIIRTAGDTVGTTTIWGANLSRNPNDEDAVVLFPYIKRVSTATYASRCTAADAGDGSRCFYTFPTCQDPANFNAGNSYEATTALKGIREYKFCLKDAPLPLGGEDIKPYIESVDNTSMKIDPEKAVTTTERFSFNFADDDGPGKWNLDKSAVGALTNTQTGVGTFLRRWLVIHKNYANPDAYSTYKVGFVASGMTEALYEQRFKGLMKDFEIDGRGRVTLTCTDFLKQLKAEIPAKISDDNLLNGAINSSTTTIYLDDVTEMSNKPTASGDYIVTILIDDEKMNVTTVVDEDTGECTVTRHAWGTTAASHSDNAVWSEVAEFGTERTTTTDTPCGKNPIDIVIELLRRGGIALTDIDTTTLESERDTWLPSTINTQSGLTTGTAFRRTITEPEKIEDLIREIREVTMLSLWVNESQQVTGKVFAPATPDTTLTALDEDNELIAGSIEVEDNDEDSRVSRALVAYNLSTDGDPEKIGDYQEVIVRVDTDAESAGFYGEKRLKTFLSQWIRASDTATVGKLLTHYLSRFKNGARLVRFALERKNDSVKVGDFVKITTEKMQDAHGNAISGRIMQVLSKKRAGQGRQEYETLDTGLLRQYGFIAPAGQANWSTATYEEKRRAYIGGATQNLLGDGEEGYAIW